MRAASFVAGLLAAVLIHLLGARIYPGLPLYLDAFALVILFNALVGGPLAGVLGGAVTGLVHDSLSGGVFGLFGFAGTLTGFTAAKVAQHLVVERSPALLLLFVSGTALYQATAILLALILLPDPEIPDVGRVVALVAVSGAAGVGAFRLLSYFRERWRVWRRRPPSRLRLD